MNVNNTVTMVVGLVVGVLLVAGLMVPVIASVSSDDGGSGSGSGGSTDGTKTYTNKGDAFFKECSSDFTMTFTAVYDNVLGYGVISADDHTWDGWPILVGDCWYVGCGSGGGQAYFTLSGMGANESATRFSSLELNGTDAYLVNIDGNSAHDVTLTNAKIYSWYEGDFVLASTENRPVYPYVSEDSRLVMLIEDRRDYYQNYSAHNFIIDGTASDNSMMQVIRLNESEATYDSSVTYTLDDPYFRGLSASIENTDVEIDCVLDDWESGNHILWVIAPVESVGRIISGGTFTNLGDIRCSVAGSSTSMTYYSVASDRWSLEPSSVSDREIYQGGLVFTAGDKIYTARVDAFIEGPTEFGIYNGETGWGTDTIRLNGTTLSFTDSDTHQTVTIQNVHFYTDPNSGDYVETIENQRSPTLYATSSSQIFYSVILDDYSDYNINIYGTVGNNSVSVVRGYDGGADIDSISDSAVFTLENGQLSTVTLTINGTEQTFDANYLEGNNGYVYACVLPVTVTEGSGGGSGLSPTLKTVLSVIPLVTVVGIVLGTVGYLRMKE